jgi:hypothetical protein
VEDFNVGEGSGEEGARAGAEGTERYADCVISDALFVEVDEYGGEEKCD